MTLLKEQRERGSRIPDVFFCYHIVYKTANTDINSEQSQWSLCYNVSPAGLGPRGRRLAGPAGCLSAALRRFLPAASPPSQTNDRFFLTHSELCQSPKDLRL